MAASLAPLIGFPILLAKFHDLSPVEIGLTMLPGAVASSVAAVLAGRLTERRGARLPAWLGSPLMLLSVLGLSTYAGSSVLATAAFVGMLGAGFGFVNTPLAATVSRIVRGQVLASALSVTTAGSLNPLHSGAAPGFSDGFLLLAIPMIAAMALSIALPGASRSTLAKPEVVARPEPPTSRDWVANCSVPWSPECVEGATIGQEGPNATGPG